ncbi:hypothetical protein FE257_010864 [Aspergillus nanangensis]|uniref:Zn(2)-C6 fungal-type domain-containing protein n=1 Tax=Aspergillus nanangensis TaxID=2582783 RepID=A0AAD4CXJ9_ASPNN|nr:hypothetical protein FE257_010864 [Aspergillus nanangensis]
MSKPVIVIVPGAWHRPEHYQRLVDELAKTGYEAEAVTMPSVDSNPPFKSWDQDAAAVRRVITKYLDAGRDVIPIAHSFGGVSMSEGVKGLGKTVREGQGQHTGVKRMIYMCAMALPKGQSHITQMKPVGAEEEELERERQEAMAKYGGITFTEDGAMVLEKSVVRDVFYDGCDPTDVEQALALLGSHPAGPLAVPATYTAYLEIPSTYIVCENDRALPSVVQRRMIAQGNGAFEVETCNEGHSPFLSNPAFVVDCVRRAAGNASDMYTATAASPAQPQRRQNTSCDPCRRSKRRCVRSISSDGGPGTICTNCERLGYACTYNFAQSRLKSTSKRRRQSSANAGLSIESSDKSSTFERPITDAPSEDLQLDCVTNHDILASWLDLDFASGLDDSLPFLPSTTVFPTSFESTGLESPGTVEIERDVSAGLPPSIFRRGQAGGSIAGSSPNSPVHLLYSKLDETILDERLIRIYNAIVSGSSSRFLNYDSNLFASGDRYKIENIDSDSALADSQQKSSAMSSDCYSNSSEVTQLKSDTQKMPWQNTENRMTILGMIRFLDHFSDLYGNRSSQAARKKSNEALNAVLKTFALQWLPSGTQGSCQHTWNSPPDIFAEAWSRARALLKEADPILSFRVAYAIIMFDGIAIPANELTESLAPHELLDIGLEKFQRLDGLVTRYCANLGPSSRYAALLEASLNIGRWGAYIRDTGAALTADRHCKLPDILSNTKASTTLSPMSLPNSSCSWQELDHSIPNVCQTAFAQAFFVWRKIIDVKSGYMKETDGNAGLCSGATDAITSAVAAVGAFDQRFRPFMHRCMENFKYLSIGSKSYLVSFVTVWNLGVLALAESLNPLLKAGDSNRELPELSNMHTCRQEAISSVVQTVESVLSLPTEEAFNVQNGLSADVPIIAYHITPGLISAALEKTVEHILTLQFPDGWEEGCENPFFDGTWSHQINIIMKGLVSLSVTIGGSQTAGVALQRLMQRYGDILSECWSCDSEA